jgi:hypothetical protein
MEIRKNMGRLNKMIFMTEEMATLVKTPMMLVGSVCSCNGVGLFGYFREMAAAEAFFRAPHKEYNPLVQRVLEKICEAEDKNETLDDFSHVSCEEVQEHLEYIYDLLADHPDGVGYMQFLYDLAKQVAAASGSGLFGSGSKISPQEAYLLTTIQEKLHLDHAQL